MEQGAVSTFNMGRNECSVGECYSNKLQIPVLKEGDNIEFKYREGRVLGMGGLDDIVTVTAKYQSTSMTILGGGDVINVDPNSVKINEVSKPFEFFHINRIIFNSLEVEGGNGMATAKSTLDTILRRVKNVELSIKDVDQVKADKDSAIGLITNAFLYLDPILRYQTCYDELFSEIPDKQYKAPFIQMEKLSQLTLNLKDADGKNLGIGGIRKCIKNINVDKVEFFKTTGDDKDIARITAKLSEIFTKYQNYGLNEKQGPGQFMKQKYNGNKSPQYFTFIGVADTTDMSAWGRAKDSLNGYLPIVLLPDGTYTDFRGGTKIYPSSVIQMGESSDKKDIILFKYVKATTTGREYYSDTRYSKAIRGIRGYKEQSNNTTQKSPPSNKTTATAAPAAAPAAATAATAAAEPVEATLGGKRRTKKKKKNRK